MKRISLFITCSLMVANLLSASEHRIIIAETGCSGRWIFQEDINQPNETGTYNHCSETIKQRNSKETKSEVYTQAIDEDFLYVQPLVESSLPPAEEDIAKVIKQSAQIKIYPIADISGANFRFRLEEKYEGIGTYSIIGFDGKEYMQAEQIKIDNGQFELKIDLKSAETYFILLTYGDKTVSNNFKVL